MYFSKALALFLLIGLSLVYACKSETKETTTNTTSSLNTPTIEANFNRDSAYAYVARQVEFGPRVVNSEGHQACKKWLVDQFKVFGATVIEQDFQAKAYTGETLNATNIIAQYNPSNPNRILLAAHWDTRHIADSPLSKERENEAILGADDGASGVGVLLELARQLQANPIGLGVDLVLFDAEDYGESGDEAKTEEESTKNRETWALGSQYWSKNLHRAGYKPRYGVLLDMVGARNARFPKEQYSKYFAPQVVENIWQLAGNLGYSNYFHNVDGGGVTDDHFFVNTIAKIPMVDIISLPIDSQNKGFGNHWHTHDDTMEVINKRTLKAVGQVLMELLVKEDAGLL